MITPMVHLRVRSEYALEDSIVRLDDLLKRSQALNMPAVGLTDPCNLYALIKFYRGARGLGIQPIAGSDLELAADEGMITLLVRDRVGYGNLIRLISQCHTHSQGDERRTAQRSWVEAAAPGLLLLLSRYSDVGQALERSDADLAAKRLEHWQQTFGIDQVYLELQRTGRRGDEAFIHAAVDLAQKFHAPVVATNDVRFLHREDFETHETRVCIAERSTLGDPRRSRRYSPEQYFKSSEEMSELFDDIPEALTNTLHIARRCHVELTLGKSFLPEFPVPSGLTIADYLVLEARQRLEQRLIRLLPADLPDRAERAAVYYERLNLELSIINQMGFAGYFLIVMDFIRWAKENGVPVGPGRGSGAGSLVAYALKITDLDPMRYDLLFERFLNPERVSMPDFDIDFCMEGRDRVIEYVAETYGREAVSQIITFGTMAAKAVVRDVARVLGKPYGLADRIAKLIPTKPPGITLKKAREEEPQLDLLLNDPEERDHEDALEIWERACQLEGITRGVGKHAGGVLIAPGRLTDFTPIFCDEDGKWVSQYDKDDVEKVGLVKFDFLGLRTLTIIDWAMRDIQVRRQLQGEAALDLELLPLDDAATYRMIEEGKTTAVFQLESPGMKNLQKKLKPSNFEDLIALVALFRPGPLDSGMVDDFINRKHGRAEVAYPDAQYQHACLQPVLAPTYGVIVYQEQVMQIAQVMAGYSLGAADLLRRAMGKKDAAGMDLQRAQFMQGAAQQGIDATLAGHIFDLMEKFAGYGFNKSHSAAYALLSYQTAWLKLHYPAEFMAAVLSAEMHNTDAILPLIDECRALSIRIIPPHVNHSGYKFIPQAPGNIVYGLGAIKGLGQGPVDAVLTARAQGPFTGLLDFCARIDPSRVNRRSLEALIKAGALDGLEGNRISLLERLDEVLATAGQGHRDLQWGIVDMFATEAKVAELAVEANSSMPVLTDRKRLVMEKESLGLYLSGHPMHVLLPELRSCGCRPLAELKPTAYGERTMLGGMLVAWRTDKSGRAQVLLDDSTGRIEVMLTAELLADYRHLLESDQVLVAEGSIRHDKFRDGLSMQAATLYDMDSLRQRRAKGLVLSMDPVQNVPDLQELSNALSPFVDVTGVRLWMDVLLQEHRIKLRLAEGWKIKPRDELLENLREMLGDTGVKVMYE